MMMMMMERVLEVVLGVLALEVHYYYLLDLVMLEQRKEEKVLEGLVEGEMAVQLVD